MADWKLPVSYNQSYHGFAYGLMYQAGAEQNHPNFSGWAEAVYNSGVSGGYHLQAQHQSPPKSPEYNIGASNSHYPGSVMYLGDPHSHTPSGRLFISHNRPPYDQRPKETEQPSSNTPSESESHRSPDSWSSENSNPQANPATCVKKELDEETDSVSPDGSEHVSSSYPEENTSLQIMGSEDNAVQSLPPSLPEKAGKNNPRQKARTAFSTGQMDALTHRFNMQRYLSPAEMKALAELTGLTYKQVKTWFQNRRMKLKRHQKDNSWESAGYLNMPPRPQFQGEPQTQRQDQEFREAMFKKSPQQNLPYYTGGYPQPSSFPPQPPGNWPPAVTH
ncbi:homeobox protein NANOG [Coregonus clupeaformis]|uniref:Homeobox domain-containing protein n=1 Tax=Coregonus suidteri TaxID=861788 RepID=A0AAN8KE52_9TELE|nr:homeobox protein NANOG [Coregonus clupeaformis]